MDQAGQATDPKLHALSRRIGFAKFLTDKGTAIHDEAWEQVRAFFAEFPKLGKRFVANDGFYLHDQANNGSPKLNPDVLYEKLHEHWADQPDMFKRMWTRITVQPPRVVDSHKLEQQVRKGNVPEEIVQASINVPATTYSRIRKSWTREDFQRAVILDLQLDDESIVKEQIELLEGILAELKATSPTQ